jgi:hypothetical protein
MVPLCTYAQQHPRCRADLRRDPRPAQPPHLLCSGPWGGLLVTRTRVARANDNLNKL